MGEFTFKSSVLASPLFTEDVSHFLYFGISEIIDDFLQVRNLFHPLCLMQ